MQELLTPLNLAVFGGLVGGLRTAAKSEDWWFLRLTDVLIGAMVAASASQYVPADSPLSALPSKSPHGIRSTAWPYPSDC
jgi:hypothetical protein